MSSISSLRQRLLACTFNHFLYAFSLFFARTWWTWEGSWRAVLAADAGAPWPVSSSSPMPVVGDRRSATLISQRGCWGWSLCGPVSQLHLLCVFVFHACQSSQTKHATTSIGPFESQRRASALVPGSSYRDQEGRSRSVPTSISKGPKTRRSDWLRGEKPTLKRTST